MSSNHISYSIYVISNGPLKWSSAKRTYYILLYGTMLFYVAHLPHILYSKKKKNLFGASSFINVFSEDSKERQHILPVQK